MTLSADMVAGRSSGTKIINYRLTRFSGETQASKLDEVSVASVEGLRWLYGWLVAVGEYGSRDLRESTVRNELEALLSSENLSRVVDSARDVTSADNESVRMAHVLHDLRGTALQQLVGLVDSRVPRDSALGTLPAIAILASDHAKVLRHSLVGLDEESRLLDSGRRLHGVDNLRRRFPLLTLYSPAGNVEVDFAAEWTGDFALTCSEFSTVLKQLYNLMGNAARHTSDRKVLIRISAEALAEPQSARFVVANAISSTDRSTLSPEVLAKLWRGFTTTGSGMGLVASATLVAEAFGLNGPKEAVDLGYVGSRITENGFISWLHWPVAVDSAA